MHAFDRFDRHDDPTYCLYILSGGSRRCLNVAFRSRTLARLFRYVDKRAHWKSSQRAKGRRWIEREGEHATTRTPKWGQRR